MNNISFGRMTPRAREAAELNTMGLRFACSVCGSDKAVLRKQEYALSRAINDKNYLFDINPERTSKKSPSHTSLNLVVDDTFLMYRTSSDNHKYSYLGEFDFLPEACQLADRIESEITLHKRWGGNLENFAKNIAHYICNADKSRTFEEARTEGKKIFDIIA